MVSVTDYGAFVELEAGVEGLIHISEMTWSRRMKHPSKVVKPGDTVESVVLEVNVKGRRAAERLDDAVLLPPLPFGVTRYGAAFAGAVGISEATLRAIVLDVAAALDAQGFRRLVIVENNHFEPEQVTTLRAAAQEAGAVYLDLVRRRNAERLTDEFRRGSCHAGRYETSLVLADAPELVDREAMAGLTAVEVDMPAAIAAGRTDFGAMGMDAAYCGAPAEATAEEGRATFEALTDMLVELVREEA